MSKPTSKLNLAEFPQHGLRYSDYHRADVDRLAGKTDAELKIILTFRLVGLNFEKAKELILKNRVPIQTSWSVTKPLTDQIEDFIQQIEKILNNIPKKSSLFPDVESTETQVSLLKEKCDESTLFNGFLADFNEKNSLTKEAPFVFYRYVFLRELRLIKRQIGYLEDSRRSAALRDDVSEEITVKVQRALQKLKSETEVLINGSPSVANVSSESDNNDGSVRSSPDGSTAASTSSSSNAAQTTDGILCYPIARCITQISQLSKGKLKVAYADPCVRPFVSKLGVTIPENDNQIISCDQLLGYESIDAAIAEAAANRNAATAAAGQITRGSVANIFIKTGGGKSHMAEVVRQCYVTASADTSRSASSSLLLPPTPGQENRHIKEVRTINLNSTSGKLKILDLKEKGSLVGVMIQLDEAYFYGRLSQVYESMSRGKKATTNPQPREINPQPREIEKVRNNLIENLVSRGAVVVTLGASESLAQIRMDVHAIDFQIAEEKKRIKKEVKEKRKNPEDQIRNSAEFQSYLGDSSSFNGNTAKYWGGKVDLKDQMTKWAQEILKKITKTDTKEQLQTAINIKQAVELCKVLFPIIAASEDFLDLTIDNNDSETLKTLKNKRSARIAQHDDLVTRREGGRLSDGSFVTGKTKERFIVAARADGGLRKNMNGMTATTPLNTLVDDYLPEIPAYAANQNTNSSSEKNAGRVQYVLPHFQITKANCSATELEEIRKKTQADIIIVPHKESDQELRCRVYCATAADSAMNASSSSAAAAVAANDTSPAFTVQTMELGSGTDDDDKKYLANFLGNLGDGIKQKRILSFFDQTNFIGGDYGDVGAGITHQIIHAGDAGTLTWNELMQANRDRTAVADDEEDKVKRTFVYHTIRDEYEDERKAPEVFASELSPDLNNMSSATSGTTPGSSNLFGDPRLNGLHRLTKNYTAVNPASKATSQTKQFNAFASTPAAASYTTPLPKSIFRPLLATHYEANSSSSSLSLSPSLLGNVTDVTTDTILQRTAFNTCKDDEAHVVGYLTSATSGTTMSTVRGFYAAELASSNPIYNQPVQKLKTAAKWPERSEGAAATISPRRSNSSTVYNPPKPLTPSGDTRSKRKKRLDAHSLLLDSSSSQDQSKKTYPTHGSSSQSGDTNNVKDDADNKNSGPGNSLQNTAVEAAATTVTTTIQQPFAKPPVQVAAEGRQLWEKEEKKNVILPSLTSETAQPNSSSSATPNPAFVQDPEAAKLRETVKLQKIATLYKPVSFDKGSIWAKEMAGKRGNNLKVVDGVYMGTMAAAASVTNTKEVAGDFNQTPAKTEPTLQQKEIEETLFKIICAVVRKVNSKITGGKLLGKYNAKPIDGLKGALEIIRDAAQSGGSSHKLRGVEEVVAAAGSSNSAASDNNSSSSGNSAATASATRRPNETKNYAASEDGDPVDRYFSKKFQEECLACGILSGRDSSGVGLRTTFIPLSVIQMVESKIKSGVTVETNEDTDKAFLSRKKELTTAKIEAAKKAAERAKTAQTGSAAGNGNSR